MASDLLAKVKDDLFELKEMANGNKKFTNVIRLIAQDLHTDVVPKRWMTYPMATVTVTEWLMDFKARLEQLSALA